MMQKSLLSGRRRWIIAGTATALLACSAAATTAAFADDGTESDGSGTAEMKDFDDDSEGTPPKSPKISAAEAAEAAESEVDKSIVTSLELGKQGKSTVWGVEAVTKDTEHDLIIDGADGSVRADESEKEQEADDWDEAKRAADKASRDLADVVKTAKGEFDGTVTGVELDDHAGEAVWNVEIIGPKGGEHGVSVDAVKGSVISTQSGDDDGDRSDDPGDDDDGDDDGNDDDDGDDDD